MRLALVLASGVIYATGAALATEVMVDRSKALPALNVKSGPAR